MKKTHKILITIIAIFVLCASLVWWQFGNIRALYYWAKYSDDDIDTLMGKSFTEVENYLSDNPQYNVRPSKPIEEQLHKEGVINDEELTNLITEKTTVKEMFGTELELSDGQKITIVESGEQIDADEANKLKEETASSSGQTETPKPNNDAKVSECIAQVYVLKAKFVAELDVIYNQAFSEYQALWRDMTEEERDAKKRSLLAEVYPKASSLERDCDAQMNQLLSKLSKLLEDAGEGTGLADQIRESYYNEKSLKKAHYLSLLT